MKYINSKVIHLILLILCSINLSHAQTPPSWFTPSWTWTNSANSNWISHVSGNAQQMGSPFTSNSSSSDIISIASAQDYKPEQGWVLLFKDFGYHDFVNPTLNSQNVDGDLPLFILYNKYTGTIRCFFYSTNFGNVIHNSGIIKLFWNTPNNTNLNNSLLTLGNNYPKPNSAYQNVGNSDAILNYLQNYPNASGWFTTEFKVHFDPNTNRNTYDQKVVFKFQLTNTGNVALSGGFSFITQSATANEQSITGVQNVVNNTNYENFAITAKKFLGKVPKKSDVENAFTQIENGVNTLDGKFCNNFTRDLHNMNNSLQNGELKKFLIGAAGFIPYVGTGLNMLSTVVDLFSNKSNTIAAAASDDLSVQPTISQGQITLNGTINSEYNGRTLSLQVPGTKHKDGGGNRNYNGIPYYDCPLGVLSLKNTPILRKRSYTFTSTTNYVVQSVLSVCCNAVPSFDPNTAASFGQYSYHNNANNFNTFYRNTTCTKTDVTPVVSYKLDEILELDFNLASDATITTAKVALMFEILPTVSGGTIPSIKPASVNSRNFFINQNQCKATNMWPDLPPGNGLNYILSSNEIGYTNFTRKNLNDGVLKISNYDNVNRLHKFQTQFVDFDKANGLAATFEDGNVRVFVKILVVLKPNDPLADQTPITQMFTYEVKNFANDNTSNTPYPSICNQLEEIEDDAKATLCNGINATVTSGNLTGTSIANLCDLTVNPHLITPNSLADWKADNSIKLRPPFKTTIAGGDVYRARISPTGLCTNGTNALQVNTYFANCDPDPSNYRLLNTSNLDSTNTVNSVNYDVNNVNLVNTTLKMEAAPNPNMGSFKLLFNKVNPAGKIIIKNNLQETVYEANVKEDEFLDIQLHEGLSNGVYFIIFVDTKGVFITQKMIKK